MSSGRRPSLACAVMNCRRRATLRSVSEVFSEAAAPSAAVTPGTTVTGTPASRQPSISSLARPKIIGSPPLRRTTCLPSRASATIIAVISSCLQEGR